MIKVSYSTIPDSASSYVSYSSPTGRPWLGNHAALAFGTELPHAVVESRLDGLEGLRAHKTMRLFFQNVVGTYKASVGNDHASMGYAILVLTTSFRGKTINEDSLIGRTVTPLMNLLIACFKLWLGFGRSSCWRTPRERSVKFAASSFRGLHCKE